MSNKPKLVISANQSNKNYWKDMWQYKSLFYFLSWRDITVRYKQTALGVAWSILQPLLAMLIFVLVFEKVAKLPSVDNTPYALMVFAALIPWQFFANAINYSSNSLINNANIVSKVYFPKMLIPISSISVALIDLLLSLTLMGFMMIIYKITPTIKLFMLPIFIIMLYMLVISLGLIFSAINVRFRDFRIIVPFLLQIGIYISPVGFSSQIVPEKLLLFYSLNPLVSIIEGFRWCLLDIQNNIYLPGLYIACTIILLISIIGVMIFKNMERNFTDII